jgi:hemolysin activation/secretion protein
MSRIADCVRAAGAAASLGVAFLALPAGAQVQLPGSVLPGRDRPTDVLVPDTNFDLHIDSPRRSPVPRAVDELRFPLRDIRINGATVIPPEELRALYEKLIGEEVGLSDIVGVAEEIEAAYRARGYILTRAFVPPQRVGDGAFQINVVEGFVRAASVEGGDPATRRLIEAYLAPVTASRPLTRDVMERALLLANDLPGVSAAGLLRPSPDEPGAADLVVTVSERPLIAAVSLDNRGSKFTGPWTLSGDAAYTALPGGPHQILAGVAGTPTSKERLIGQLRYVRPVGTDGASVSFGGVGSYGEPGSTLKPLELTTSSYAVGPRASYPVIRTRANTLTVDGGLTVQYARVTSGIGISESDDNWRVADISTTYLNNGFLSGVTSATFGVAQGIDGFGASPMGAGRSRPDGAPDFTKLTASLRRTQLVDGPFSVFGQVVGQYATKALFAGEEIAFGGNQIGRGYDPAALTGDAGVGGTFELRYDQPINEWAVENAQFYAFYDAATVTNRGAGQLSRSLNSTGLGVRLTLTADLALNIEFAQPLEAVQTSDNGRKGSRILFGASARF